MLVRYELQKITWSQDQKQQTQLRGTTFSKFSDEVAPIEGTKTVVADLPHCSESTKESTRALCRAGDFGIDTLAGLLAEITECPTWRKNTEVEVLLNVDLIADKAKKKTKKLGGDVTQVGAVAHQQSTPTMIVVLVVQWRSCTEQYR